MAIRWRPTVLYGQSSHGRAVRTRRLALYNRSRIVDVAPDSRQLLHKVLVAAIDMIDLFELGFAVRDQSRQHHADRRTNVDRRNPGSAEARSTVYLRRCRQQLATVANAINADVRAHLAQLRRVAQPILIDPLMHAGRPCLLYTSP